MQRFRWIWLVPFVPFMLTGGMALAARTEPGALLAPFLGPWAGHAFGHSDCTLATSMPLASVLAAAFGAGSVVAALRSRGQGFLAPIALTLWALVWEGLALLSIVNTLE